MISLSSCSAWAGPDDGSDVAVTLGVTSDYRFRGISLSERRPALQGGVEAEHGGWFVGSWASTISEDGRSSVEVDVYGGQRGVSGAFSYSAGIYAYSQPGEPGSRYVELQARAGRDLGLATLEVEAAYAPARTATPGNIYAGININAPIDRSGLSVLAHGGLEQGLFDRKLDWELGAEWTRGSLKLRGSVVGAEERRRRLRDGTRVVLSLAGEW